MYREPYDISNAESEAPGPSLCVVGGVHGDEPAGVQAVEFLRSEFRSGQSLKKGRLVTLVANSKAVAEKRRAVDFDLNRAFGDRSLSGHEADLSELLVRELAGTDFVLDLHSTSAESPVFGAGAPSARHAEFCGAVGIGIYSYGWSEPRDHTMLVDAADRMGATGLLVECGQHKGASTLQTAIDCSRRALTWLEMIEPSYKGSVEIAPPRIVRVREIVKAKSDSFRFRELYSNFQWVRMGEEVGVDGDEPWVAAWPFLILIPAQQRIYAGEDAFAIGEWVDRIP